MRRARDVGGADEPLRAQSFPQQRERVAAQRQPQRAVVGDDVLAFGGRRQGGWGFRERGAGEERRQALHTRDVPDGGVPVAGEARERTSGGERGQRAAVKPRAVREVGDVRERALRARGDDALRAVLLQAGDHPQAEAQHRRCLRPVTP